MNARKLLRRVLRLRRLIKPDETFDHRIYKDDPLGFIRDVLHVTLTPAQTRVVEKLIAPPRRLLVAAGHSVGKTLLAACLILWWFWTRNPSACITTAPTDSQVRDLLWKEVRTVSGKANLPPAFTGPSNPAMRTRPDHYAKGFTAREATRFQGHHSPGGVFIVFDEAEGVESEFWKASKSMLDDNSLFLAIYNPTTTGSAAHVAEMQSDDTGVFARTSLSCLDHPNIEAALAGLPPPVPGAITLDQLRMMLLEDSLVLNESDEAKPGDIELAGVRYRPGPVAEARCLGRRATSSTSGLWSEEIWKRVLSTRLAPLPSWPVAIGCDVARYGDDSTALFVRKGLCLLHAEVHLKLSTKQVAQRVRELCHLFKDEANSPKLIPCMIDEGGIGGGVIDQHEGYRFVPVNAACSPRSPRRYKNVRSEVCFVAREPALQGNLDVHRIPPMILNRLKAELLAYTYKVLPGKDQLVVASKDDLKAILGRSPDVADAFHLAMYPPPAQV